MAMVTDSSHFEVNMHGVTVAERQIQYDQNNWSFLIADAETHYYKSLRPTNAEDIESECLIHAG